MSERLPDLSPSTETAAPEAEVIIDGVRYYSNEFYETNLGISLEDAQQPATWTNSQGVVQTMPLAAALDPNGTCPLAGYARNAFKKDGVKGVHDMLETFGQFDDNLEVTFTESTYGRMVGPEPQKKTPETSQKIMSVLGRASLQPGQ